MSKTPFVNNDYDKQNKRYKQALEFYAKVYGADRYELSNWQELILEFYAKEYGADRAIRALEGEE